MLKGREGKKKKSSWTEFQAHLQKCTTNTKHIKTHFHIIHRVKSTKNIRSYITKYQNNIQSNHEWDLWKINEEPSVHGNSPVCPCELLKENYLPVAGRVTLYWRVTKMIDAFADI